VDKESKESCKKASNEGFRLETVKLSMENISILVLRINQSTIDTLHFARIAVKLAFLVIVHDYSFEGDRF